MAQVKEPYGLVYNTDGSLCTTYRDDDIPFSGVRSFAVEEATENLFDNFDLTTWTKKSNMTSEYYRLTGETYLGCPIAEFGKPGEDRSSDGYVDRYIFKIFDGLTEGDVYTFSVYAYVLEAGYSGLPTIYTNSIELQYATEVPTVWFSDLPVGKWVRVELTGTVGAKGQIYPRVDIDNSYIRLACPQLEKKSFATSFVDGSRPNGNILLPFTEKDDFVITFWFKPDWEWGSEPAPISEEKTYNLLIWGSPGSNGFLLRLISSGEIELLSFAQARSTTYNVAHFNDFVNFVIKKVDKIIIVYANGEKIIEQTNTNLVEPTENVLWFGSRQTSTRYGRANGLFSNIFIGKYRKPDGTVIWTDDYIREVYEAKIPFPVQSQLSVF